MTQAESLEGPPALVEQSPMIEAGHRAADFMAWYIRKGST